MSARVLGSGAAAIVLSSILTAAAAQAPRRSSAHTSAPPAPIVDTSSKAPASTGVPQCAAGMVLIPASLANPAATSPASAATGMSGVPSLPSPTGLLVSAAKKKLLKKGDSVPPAAGATTTAQTASPFLCVTPVQAQAYLQSAQAASAATTVSSPEQAAAAQKAAMKSVVATAFAATPQGMLVSGAAAAAPTAGNAVKSLAGRFGRGDSKENMIRDLRQGRLQLKGIRFVNASDEMADGFEQSLAMLADALQSVDGQFALVVLAESDGKSAPDTATARRRAARVVAHLQLAGIGADRLVIADDAVGAHTPGGRTLGTHIAASKPPKMSEARVELVRVGGAKP